MLSNLPLPLQSAAQTTTAQNMEHWLSESEEDQPVFAAPAAKKVEPIRVKIPRKRNVASQKRAQQEDKPKRQRSAKSCRTTSTAKTATPTVAPPAISDPKQAFDRGFEQAATRRLKLETALELAGKLYDSMNDRNKRCVNVSCDYSVFSMLCLRGLVLETLSKELTVRNVLPVTINTLSKLFAQAYAHVV